MKNRVKITTVEFWLNLFYPCYCKGCGIEGEAFCGSCKIYNTLQNPPFLVRFGERNSLRLFVGGVREGVLSRMLIDYKYKSERVLSWPIAEILYAAVKMGCERYKIDATKFIVVPLPTVSKHIRKRGFDHTRLLAEKLAEKLGGSVELLIERAKNTVQVGADKKTRKTQAEKAYKLREGASVRSDVEYLLIDDIWTTGSSMKAAVKILRAAGVKNISCAVVAKNRR